MHVLDDTTLLIPDWPGNNRLDTLMNIEANPEVGLLFLIPGFNESLRVNGVADVSLDPSLLARWDVNGKHPRSVLRVSVREAFLHCGKAILRSKLWDETARVDRSALPPYGQMLKDQIDVRDSAEEIQASVGRDAPYKSPPLLTAPRIALRACASRGGSSPSRSSPPAPAAR